MKTILHIILKEFWQIRRDKRMLGVTLLAPVFQLLLLGYAATTDVRSIPMAVCDEDRSATSRELLRQFTNSGYFVHAYDVMTPRDIDHYLDDGDAWVGLVIPPEFGTNVLARRPAPLQLISDGTNSSTAGISLGYAGQVVSTFSRSIALTQIERRPQLTAPPSVNTEVRVWYNPELKSRNYMVPGVVAMILLIITMTLTSIAIVREKESGTLEQLLVTPIKPFQLIIGKLMPFVLIGIADVTLVLTVARFWFDVPLRGSVILLYMMSGVFVLTTLGLGLFISTISKTQQQAMMTAQFFIFMPSIFLSGFTFPIQNMPQSIQYVTYVIPLRYFMEIIRGIFLKGDGIAELWPQGLALLTFGIIILTLSILRFHKRLA
ncbi:MAG: ABC transporter permease [Ignavibacteriales bacterium CG07_land_8_20_14_0_80_59_12]|nr:MAG: ABC transporter permease [Ignavibacteriales bacterium CG07_land_8_20_14_0_80_59_12]